MSILFTAVLYINPPLGYLCFPAQARQFLSEDDLKFYLFHDVQRPGLCYLYVALSLPPLIAAMPEKEQVSSLNNNLASLKNNFPCKATLTTQNFWILRV